MADETLEIEVVPEDDETRSRLLSAKIGCIGTILAAVIAAAVPILYERAQARTPRGQDAQPSLTFEVNGERRLTSQPQRRQLRLAGTHAGFPKRSEVWMAVWPEAGGDGLARFYGPVELFLNGDWSLDIELSDERGASEPRGPARRFRVRTLLLNPSQADALRANPKPRMGLDDLAGRGGRPPSAVSELLLTRGEGE